METREYRSVDKSDWGPGPWQDEPDKLQWQDKATGLPCLIVRSCTSGALCGYVGVAEGHPAFGKGYSEMENVEVHGGLSFSDLCEPNGAENSRICHVPAPGEPEHVWWLGFDCAHGGTDLSPFTEARMRKTPLGGMYYPGNWQPTYKPLAWVKAQVALLAAQLGALA